MSATSRLWVNAMGRIERLKAVTGRRIEAFLASLENPEIVMPQLVREMGDAVDEAARAEAKALTAVKADRRRFDTANGRADRLLSGAKLALKAGERETARQAVAARIETERDIERCREDLARSEAAYASASHVRRQLQDQLSELKRRRGILARVRTLRQESRGGSRSVRGGTRAQPILEAIARIEMQVEEEEAKLEIRSQIQQTLGVAFQHERAVELEGDAEVDRRLEALRNEINGTA
jgi:phage shock protein A